MVNIRIIGRLGANAEIKTSSKGNQFVSMRVAVNQYNATTKANDTIWFNVTAFGERDVAMAQYWTKGKLLTIEGTESVSLYKTKEGESGISRDIRAFFIDFISVGSGATETNTSETAASPTTTTTADCGVFKKPTIVAEAIKPTPSNTDVDDLPF